MLLNRRMFTSNCSNNHSVTTLPAHRTYMSANTASLPPAPGTPAATTPGSSIVASHSAVCASGSTPTPALSPIVLRRVRVRRKREFSFSRLWMVVYD